jgi:hypothetical protein
MMLSLFRRQDLSDSIPFRSVRQSRVNAVFTPIPTESYEPPHSFYAPQRTLMRSDISFMTVSKLQ